MIAVMLLENIHERAACLHVRTIHWRAFSGVVL